MSCVGVARALCVCQRAAVGGVQLGCRLRVCRPAFCWLVRQLVRTSAGWLRCCAGGCRVLHSVVDDRAVCVTAAVVACACGHRDSTGDAAAGTTAGVRSRWQQVVLGV